VIAAGPAAEASAFPQADQIIPDLASPELAATAARGPCFAVVATMGESDEESIRAALAVRPTYLGVVASSTRFAQIRRTLEEGGVPAAALDTIRSPAGLSIGAQAPEEIAVSILAEIIEARRLAQAKGDAEVSVAAPAAGSAIDPVCGMTVEVAAARHTAEHAGRTWYFCCGGCRERFLAAPARFAGQGAA
jgi:xanthine dehydrogenase accessory factor